MAVHIVGQIPANATVAVFSDNQSTLQAITKPPDGPAGHIILYVNNAMRALSTHRPTLTRNLRFHWISSHSGVYGNELADRVAKEAARGVTSPGHDLPRALSVPFPRSSTAIWTTYKEGIDKKWMAAFAKSPRGVRLLRSDRNFHPRRYYKLAKELHRSQTSIVNQLRSGHVALNTYLHRIKRRDDPFASTALRQRRPFATMFLIVQQGGKHDARHSIHSADVQETYHTYCRRLVEPQLSVNLSPPLDALQPEKGWDEKEK